MAYLLSAMVCLHFLLVSLVDSICGISTVCHGLFALPLGIISGQCLWHIYCLPWFVCTSSWYHLWTVFVACLLSAMVCLHFLLVSLVDSVCGMSTVCHGLFALSLGIISGQCLWHVYCLPWFVCTSSWYY